MEQPNAPQGNPQDQKAPETRPDLIQELRQLAETLEQAVRGLTSSDKTKELEHELRRGVSTLREQTEVALKEAKVQEAAQEFGTQAKRVAHEAISSQPAQQALSIISRGIVALNQQLERFISKANEDKAAASAPAPEATQPDTSPERPVS